MPEPFHIPEPRRIGAVVRELRRAQGLTQAELAQRAGVSRGYLVRLEQGHPKAELKTVIRVLDALSARLMVAEFELTDEERAMNEAFDRLFDD